MKRKTLEEEVMKGEKENALLALLTAIVIVVVAVTWSTPLSAQDGPTLFKTKCAVCHGADGKGETPMGKKLNIRDLSSPGGTEADRRGTDHHHFEGQGKDATLRRQIDS